MKTMAALGRSLALSVLVVLLAASVDGQTEVTTSPGKLVVGTMRIPPFVMRTDDGQWSGPSIELWTQVAAELKADFEFREYDYDPAGLLAAIERHEIDAAIAAIPMTTEGESRFDFSHPYFAAGLGIAVRAEPQRGLAGMLTSFATLQVLGTVAGLLGVLLAVGALMWLAERRQSGSQFHERPVRGIGEGLWWAAVTMTTTGYGDKVPIGWRGRAVGLVWMLASIFIIALFSATMASSFVVNRLQVGINGPEDLARARVATVSGTAGEEWLTLQGLTGRTYPFVIQASKALHRGDVQALIYERAILAYMIKQYGWRDLQILPHTLAVRDYAIALPANSPMKEPINRALLKVVHQPAWRDVLQRYVGVTEAAGPVE